MKSRHREISNLVPYEHLGGCIRRKEWVEVIAIVEDVVVVYEAPVTVSKRGFGGEVGCLLTWAGNDVVIVKRSSMSVDMAHRHGRRLRKS